MEKLLIEPTLNSPKIVLDPEANIFEFSGESRPENVRNFYLPVLEWLDQFSAAYSNEKGSGQPREFHFNFEYFNSTSAKYILDVFKALNVLDASGNEVLVKWHFEADDEDMLEVGKEMARMAKLPFEFIKIDV
jgi:hypothetical protein